MIIQESNLLGLGSADVGQGLGAYLGTLAIFLGFFTSGGFLFSLEFLDPAELIDKAHLAREEGVAFGTDVDGQISLGGASRKLGTARTGDGDLIVFGVDRGFHERDFSTD